MDAGHRSGVEGWGRGGAYDYLLGLCRLEKDQVVYYFECLWGFFVFFVLYFPSPEPPWGFLPLNSYSLSAWHDRMNRYTIKTLENKLQSNLTSNPGHILQNKNENKEEKGEPMAILIVCRLQTRFGKNSTFPPNLPPTLILGSLLFYAQFYWKNCPIELRHSETKTR